MAGEAALILRTLEQHLEGPAHVRLFGGAAVILGYGATRATEDADLLQDDSEVQLMIEQANIGEALAKTNKELEPRGLYISHVWGPEQQILGPRWREDCRPVPAFSGRLRLSVLGPMDLIVSKLARLDDVDIEDARYLIATECLTVESIRAALELAIVPAPLAEIFKETRPRLEALLASLSKPLPPS